MKQGKKILQKNLAQTSIEVAVFGSILIFVVGLIVRQALGFSHQQNQNLKAMRWAMTKSYTTTSNASRVSASVLLIEDRLSASSNKYGSIDRNPYFVSGSAIHSRNLYMPLEPNDVDSMPVYDVFVNGLHFPFTVAAFKSYSMLEGSAVPPPGEDSVNGRELFYRGTTGNDWYPDCIPATPGDPFASPPVPPTPAFGCPLFYVKVPNHYAVTNWDNSIDSRFDLNRDGTDAGPEDVPSFPVTERENFSWQWMEVKGLLGEVVFDPEDSSKNKNFSIDVDGDLKTEQLIENPTVDENGVITSVRVIDSGEGDLDFSFNTADAKKKEAPGFLQDSQMYTRSKEGTYLLIEEGKLFGPGKQFVRTASKKNQVDIVVRIINMSNDTGRFCTDMQTSGNPTRPATILFEGVNPVEACCNSSGCSVAGATTCFDPSTVTKTCMSYLGPDDILIYVRSRIENMKGHKWVTDRDADPYVNFTVPAL